MISSMLASQFDKNFAQDIEAATRVRWEFVQVGLEVEKVVPADNILRLRHEDLVAAPERVADRVVKFLRETSDREAGEAARAPGYPTFADEAGALSPR